MSVSRIALTALAGLALGGVYAAPASAADLGGDCCADLEERVAELEATTVRKGNRKVSVTLYGQVNEAVMYWDDGIEENVYIVGNGHSQSKFGLKGKAKIVPGWSAGYMIEIEVVNARSSAVDADDDNETKGGLNVRHSMWYLKSDTLGKISVGLTSPAVDDLTHYGGQGSYAKPGRVWGGGFSTVFSNTKTRTGVSIAAITTGFDESRRNVIRYDTPTLAGFTVTASWGEDDYWDVALRYAGTIGDFKVKAAVGYNDDHDNGGNPGSYLDDHSIKAAGRIQHVPTGLFVYGAYTEENHDGTTDELDESGWHIAGGIEQKWFPIGKTTIWGEYTNSEDDGTGTSNAAAFGGAFVTSTEHDRWGVGVAQKIDAAAMTMYAVYQQSEFDVKVDGSAVPLEDFDTFVMGGVIKF